MNMVSFFIDTNIIVDWIFLNQNIENDILKKYRASVEFLDKITNLKRYTVITSSINIIELPNAISNNFVIHKMIEENLPFYLYSSFRRTLRQEFSKDITKLSNNFVNQFIGAKLIELFELRLNINIIEDINQYQLKYKLSMPDAFILRTVFESECKYLVTRDYDFKEKRESIKRDLNIEIISPEDALEITRQAKKN